MEPAHPSEAVKLSEPAESDKRRWLPILLFILAMAWLWADEFRLPSFISPGVLLGFTFVFSTLISLFVACLVARSFMTRGRPALLLLGCGVLIWGATGVISIAADPSDINANVAIFDCGVWMAALCHLGGTLLSLRRRGNLFRANIVWVAAAYTVAVGTLALVARLAAGDLMPVFFVQGRGGTPLRQFVLGSAVAMFFASAAVLRVANRRALSRFIDWYSLALLLIAAGLAGVLVEASFGSALSWTARAAQYTGGIYMLVAALVSLRDSRELGFTLEAALRDATERFQDLFDLASDGIVVYEFGEGRNPGRFERANPAACKMLGYSVAEMRALTLFDLVVPEEQAKVREDMEATRREGMLRYEKTLHAKDGRRIPMEIATRLFRQGGRLKAISAIRDITERKRTEREREQLIGQLGAERALLDTVVTNTAGGISLVRASDLAYVVVNPAFQALAPGKEFLGRTIAEVWPELPRLEALYRRILRTGEPSGAVDQKVTVRRSPEGPLEERYFNWMIARVRLPGDEAWGVLTTITETTDRVRAREAADATTRQLERVLASITEGYYALDSEWRFVEMNAIAEQQFGRPFAEMVGKNIWQEFEVGPGSPFYDQCHLAVQTGRPVHFEAASRVRPGHWSELHVYPHGERLEVYFHDITARKLAVDAVRESEERYRGLFESMQEGFLLAEVITDAAGQPVDHRYVEVNAACESILGRTREEIAGRTHSELFAGTQWQGWTALFAPAALTGAPVRLELEGGGRHYDALVYQPQAGRFAVLFTDITERKRVDENLRQAQKLESLGLLAGGIAHDFNNLLVGIMGYASLAQEMLPKGHQAAELLAGVVESGEHAAHLTRQMLAYSGKGRFVVEPLDISALVAEISELVTPSLPKNVMMHLDLDRDLPPVEADRGQIQQVVMNLVLNAGEAIGAHAGLVSVRTGLKELDPGGRPFDVAAADLRGGAYVFVEVRDTGSGMDQVTRARIFDPFFTTKFTGRGLGLAAVAGIIRGHHGAIEVTSEPGKGTCFVAWFPAALAAVLRAAEPEPPGELRGAGTVLVVDDERVVREMARLTLERYGFEVMTADNGEEGVDLLRRAGGSVCLVVLDLSMPRMGGRETLAAMRRMRPDVKVIASSGYSEEEAMRLFAGQALAGFIQKPYTAARLAAAVKAALS